MQKKKKKTTSNPGLTDYIRWIWIPEDFKAGRFQARTFENVFGMNSHLND